MTTPYATATSSLVDRMRRAATLDRSLYEAVEHDRGATGQAAVVVALSAVAAAIGNAFDGGSGVFTAVVGMLVGWVARSGIAYFVGTRLFGGRATWGEVLRTLGFAQAPAVLLIFAIVPVFGWFVEAVVAVWLLATGFVALRQALDLDNTKTLLTAVTGWVALIVARGLVVGLLGLLF